MLLFPLKIFKYFIYLVIIGLLLVGITRYISPSEELVKADAIIAISGGETGTRTEHAIELYKEGWAPKLIFSGDAFDPLSPSNADVMRQIATLNNVPSNDILIEEESDNTQQNAENSSNIIEELGYESVILVTAEYHQRRAFIEFTDKLGEDISIINSPAKEEQWSKAWWWTNPKGWYLTFSEFVKIPVTKINNLY